MEVGDMERFYSGLKELGVTLDEAASGRQVAHTPSELREHFWKIGDAESVVTSAVLSRLLPDRTCADYLADPPNDSEIQRVWQKMRESAGGPQRGHHQHASVFGPNTSGSLFRFSASSLEVTW